MNKEIQMERNAGKELTSTSYGWRIYFPAFSMIMWDEVP